VNAPARSPAWHVVLQVVAIGLALGFAAGFLVAAVRALGYGRPWALLPSLWVSASAPIVVLAPLAIAGWLAIFRMLSRRMPSETARSRFATLVVGALPALFFARLVNRERLPRFLEPTSLIANALLLLAFLAAALLLARVLLGWERRALARGPSAPSVFGALAMLALGGLFAVRALHGPSGPHVFVLLVDVLRADHLGCYGYERATSPNIDRFARDAVLFEQAISASTFTKTSVASLFTGLAPYNHGVYAGDLRDTKDRITSDVLSRDLTVLAEEMRSNGYVTLGLVRNGQLRPHMGFGQGFDVYDDEPGWIARMAGSFRAERGRWPRSEPLFAYLHFLDLHAPYLPVPPYDRMFGRHSDTYDGIELESAWGWYVQQVNSGKIVPSDVDMEQLRSLYDGQLVFVDAWIGRILDDLKADHLYDSSLIVLTGDHGEAFWEHGFIHHSNAPYEELLHVPLLIKLPGSENGGSRVETPVGLIDLLPTLLDLIGARSTAPRDGTSFRDRLEAPGAEPPPPATYVSEYKATAAIRKGRWKLVYSLRRPIELFDLEEDPGERTDLYGKEPGIARELEERLRSLFEARRRRAAAERVVVDPETLRQLEALGY
jgi:arylsulfatase A-like enzyme